MRLIKQFIFCLIIFSNTCFGKEFDKLFIVFEPIINSSQIEKSINNSFNTMIYRLSGSNTPSNIWKIINEGNSRKGYIKSYSIKNFDEKSFLEVSFNKDKLIKTFNKLSIPIIGNSRPVILFLIKIDTGINEPYYLTNSTVQSSLDISIKNILKNISSSRGIFLELPELDLVDVKNLSNYRKVIGLKDLVDENYSYNDFIELNVVKTGINSWQITGGIDITISNENFPELFIDEFVKYVNQSINNFLNTFLIDTSKTELLNISINNISSFEDYKYSKKILEDLIVFKDIDMNKFDNHKVFYRLNVYGEFQSFLKEISENNFFKIESFNKETSDINIIYLK